MTNLPNPRRSRSSGVRLVPVEDLHDVQWLLCAVLALQVLILLGVVFRA